MRHPADDAASTPEAIGHSTRPGLRRTLMMLTASMLVTRPLGVGQAHPNTQMVEPPPPGHVQRPPAFAAGLTRTRAAAEWTHFKTRFVQPDGRVVDNGNLGISHSEGQGLALLFATHFNEPDTFARVLRWTLGALGRPQDHLLAWRHNPGDASRPGDRNNATDGDLLTAWALAEAAERWPEPAHRSLAVSMARDILDKAVIDGGDGPLLLPGTTGFSQSDSITINPSYYVFPAFQALSRLLPDRQWAALEEGGLRLSRDARFGRWGLVPDWVSAPRGGGRLGLAHDRPARFSYDAVRVPLYLAWGGHGAEPMVGAAAQFWHDPSLPRMPAWTDLRTDATSPYAADVGIAAVAQVSAMGSRPGFVPRQIDTPSLSPTYYAAALRLMAVLSMRTMPSPAPSHAPHVAMTALR